MPIDLGIAVAGLIVGIVVGLTGMGGGALMTPVLVIIFGITPLAAVSSDLVAAAAMIVRSTWSATAPKASAALMVLYPMLSTKELVGTDLVQVVPLVSAPSRSS
jgi:uncharacterized membrane protein YfcA